MSFNSVGLKARSILSARLALAASLTFLLGACGDSGTGSGGSGGEAGMGGEAGGGAGGTAPGAERRMFVTSSSQDGDFGGIEGADALCSALAAQAELEGEFKAWLSTLSSSVAERLAPAEDARYVLVDGTTAATSWEDLLDGSVAVPIDLDESGTRRTGDVWTGTLSNGEAYSIDDCDGFTSGTEGTGLCGTTSSAASFWTENSNPTCSTQLRLYCIEQ